MARLAFSKMHGAGNDFVVLDRRADSAALSAAVIAQMADRHRGIGFDQLLTIEKATRNDCDFDWSIWNQDGSVARQCGNGVRCVVEWLARSGALTKTRVRLHGIGGVVECERLRPGHVRARMIEPDFDPAHVPFNAAGTVWNEAAGSYAVDLARHGRVDFGIASMGNPHAVIEVADIDVAPVADLGPMIEHDRHFPDRCNVGFVQRIGDAELRLRVWERGVGETLACGSGACAAVAVLRRRGRVGANVAVHLPGGSLQIEWEGPGHPLWMSGPAQWVFDGQWEL